MKADLVDVILEVGRELQEQEEIATGIELGKDTPLFGEEGVLDSLGLVRLVVAVEQAIEDRYGVGVSLADERAMSQKNSPYRSIGSLADYAATLVPES